MTILWYDNKVPFKLPVDVIVLSSFNNEYDSSNLFSGGCETVYHINGHEHDNRISNLIRRNDLLDIADKSCSILYADPDLYVTCIDIEINHVKHRLETVNKYLENLYCVASHKME